MKYTNPTMQAIADQALANVKRADEIVSAMHQTVELGKRKEDKPVILTAQQAARIAANKGKHIYGKSHPLYKESTNE